jgi:hypothetical protein
LGSFCRSAVLRGFENGCIYFDIASYDRSDGHVSAPGAGVQNRAGKADDLCERTRMARAVACCLSVVALVAAAAPARAVGQIARDDCRARIEGLNASRAEGEHRLAEKHAAIDACMHRYADDKTIVSLVRNAPSTRRSPSSSSRPSPAASSQPSNYGNELRALKAEFGR